MDDNKVVIVTVYNSENCGSFLQAFALNKILCTNGFNVSFFKRETKGTSHHLSNRIIPIIKYLYRLDIKNAIFCLSQWFYFEKAIKKTFSTCTLKSKFISESKIIIIGSDTLWNFDVPYFKNRFHIYSGNLFNKKPIITYAISAANTSLSTFKQVLSNNKKLNISFYLTRDVHTKELIEQCINKKVEIVCDPTLLLKPSDYKIFITKKHNTKPYLLLYYFEKITKEQENYINQYCKEHNLITISLLSNRKWCNKNIVASPQNMIYYFSNAECILTDTFHGCAFSLIYEKPFAVYDEGKNKVKELLSIYKKQSHLFSHYTDLSKTLNKTNDVISNGTFDTIREKSINILLKSIKDAIQN